MRTPRASRTLAAVTAATAFVAVACADSKPNANGAPIPTQSVEVGSTTSASPLPPGTGTAHAGPPDLFQKCKDAATEPDDTPDAGVVMNNATPVGDAGTSDRLKPVEKTISENRGKYRCCFDEGGPHPPNQIVSVTMVLELKQTGEVRNVTFDRAETDTTSDAVENCLADVAKMFTYAESGVGKDTKFRHRFKFKTHH